MSQGAELQREIDAQSATADEWYSGLRALSIETDAQQEQAAEVLRKVKFRIQVLEDRRKEITVPINAALKSVNDLFREPRTRFESVEKLLKGKIASYLERKAAANVAAIQSAAAASTPERAAEHLAIVAAVAPPQGVSVRKVWKFEITDPDAVPRCFCSPDPDKIRLVEPSTAKIPGVRFYQEPVVAARRL